MRKGSANKVLLIASIFVVISCSWITAAEGGGSDDIWVPSLTLPNDTTLYLCGPEEVCFEVSASDPDANDTLVLTLVSGPIDMPPDTFPNVFTTTVCFQADGAGVYEFQFMVKDRFGHEAYGSVTFTVELGNPPVLSDQSFAAELCSLKEERVLLLSYDNPQGDWVFELVSGPGTVDPLTGAITYQPDTSGVFVFEVAVGNACGADTATITDNLVLNLPPYCVGFDTTIFLCGVEEVCFDVLAVDPEGDPITLQQLEGLGSFTRLSDTSGRTCFWPSEVDSATYRFIYRAADSCVLAADELSSGLEEAEPQCCLDTVTVIVIIDDPPQLVCPETQDFWSCDPGTFCFDIELIDNHPDEVTLNVLSGNATIDGTTVCVTADESTELVVVIEAVDDCGADTCSMPVSVRLNRSPYVTMVDDREISLCQPEIVCLPAAADDPDFNIAAVSVNFGSYDEASDIFCFPADTSGQYTLVLTAIDSCDATDSDTAIITIKLNEPPLVDLGDDFTVDECTTTEICIDDGVADDNVKSVTSNFGVYDPETGRVCFVPESSGVYTVWVTVEDDCGLTASDTVVVTVEIGGPPVITDFSDTSVFLCDAEEVCLTPQITDPDGDIATISVDEPFSFADGSVCFTPDTAGQYIIILGVTDSCGFMGVATATVTVSLNEAPVATLPDDQQFSLCQPEVLCLPATADDPNFNIAEVSVSFGEFDDASDRVCFTADTSGLYTIILTAVDSCGWTDSDTMLVTVTLNETPLIDLGPDFTVSGCEPSEVCIDVTIDDDNIGLVTSNVPGFDPESGRLCFMPDTAGVYTVWVRAEDDCGLVAADTVAVTVEIGSAPVIANFEDTTVYLCFPQEICLEPLVSDPDGDLATVTVSEPYTLSEGRICFVAFNQGTYAISLTATDSCGFSVTETAIVTIRTDQAVALECPPDTTVFLCEPDTLCFPVEGVPDGAEVKVSGTNVWWNDTTSSACFYSDCCLENTITVNVTTPCGTYSCEFTVQVQTNSEPLVILPQDTAMQFCEPTTVCLPVGITDVDGNVNPALVSVLLVDAGGTPVGEGVFDDYRDLICFDVDTSGTYIVSVTAIDSCGLADSDLIEVAVQMNTAPTIAVTDVPMEPLCELPAEVCLPFTVFDADDNLVGVSTTLGSVADNSVCFVPTDFGDYEIILTATDDCGLVGADTVVVSLVKNPGWVSIDCPPGLDTLLCTPDSVYMDVSGWFAGQDYVVEVLSPWAVLEDGFIKFYVGEEGLVGLLEIAASSDCNSDTCKVPVNAQVIDWLLFTTCPPDTTVLVCGPDTLAFPFETVGDGGLQGQVVVDPPAYLADGMIMVPVLAPGAQVVTARALSGVDGECNVDICTFSVTAEFNGAPTVSARDTSLTLCELEEICVPFEASDPDDNLLEVVSSLGSVTISYTSGASGQTGGATAVDFVREIASPPIGGKVCFTPEAFGTYEIILTAIDECGAEGYDTVVVSVSAAAWVDLQADPPVEPFLFCDGPQTICWPVTVIGDPTGIVVSYGTYDAEDGMCFVADSSGLYTITMIGVAACNEDTLDLTFDVHILDSVQVVCPVSDTSLFFCDLPRSISLPLTILGDVENITALPEGTSADGNSVLIPVDAEGEITVVVIAEGYCNVDSCTFVVNVDANEPPVLVAGNDTLAVLCELGEVCIGFNLFDPDDNLVEVRTTLGLIDDTIICFTPEAFGDYEMVITATDSCGAVAEDTVLIAVSEGTYAAIDCPPAPMSLAIDLPGSLMIPIAITPVDAEVTVLPFGRYDFGTGELIAYIEEPGTYTFTIIAAAECSSDTCVVEVEVIQYIPPLVVCEGSVDTVLCLVTPETLCMPVTVSGTAISVDVLPVGEYADGYVCLDVDTAGTYELQIIAANEAQADTCYSSLTVTLGRPPVIDMPDSLTFALCDPAEVCVPAVFEDTDFDIAEYSVSFGTYDDVDEQICFDAEATGVYTIIVSVSDSCGNVAIDTAVVTVNVNAAPTVSAEPGTYFICEEPQVCVAVDVVDENIATVVTSMGDYDAQAGQVCFIPDTSGVYTLIVQVTDSCGAVAADTADLTIQVNQVPVISGLTDTSIYICSPQEICLSTEVVDADGNLVSVTFDGPGTYEDGLICFIPFSMGQYQFTLTAEDVCGAITVVTAVVTIETDQSLSLKCPADTTVFLCEADTLCFPVDGIPEGAEVTVNGTNVWWDEATSSACFYSDCCLENTITVNVATACGTYSCDFTVTVQTNSRPLVILPQDKAVVQCQFEEICLPVGITDVDNNVLLVTADGGVFDDYRDLVCFTPDTSGLYKITVTATDSCGLSDSDEILVDVTLNRPPVITYESPGAVTVCEFEEICLPVDIDDPDGNLDQVNVVGGRYDEAGGTVCFTPQDLGQACLSIIATDTCGLKDSIMVCVEVAAGDSVAIDCPVDPFPSVQLCAADQVCVPLAVTGESYTVSTSFGGWSDGTLCFQADTSGLYEITVVADAECNRDTCVVAIPVDIPGPVTITCPPDANEPLCDPDTVCYPFEASSSALTVTATSPAYISGGEVCVPILEPGVLEITMIASGDCGADTCSFTVSAEFNEPPVIVAGPDTSLTECGLAEICIDLQVTDADDNIESITASLGNVSGDSAVCFTPPDFGTYEIVVEVFDACGEKDADTVTVTVSEGEAASIFCPDDVQHHSICGPGNICVIAPISPPDAKVTVSPSGYYDPGTGTICIYADTGGSYDVKVIAEAQCVSDTCEFTLKVNMAEPPAVTCPETVDTLLCLAEPETLCVPVEITGTITNVTVSPIGNYAAGFVCVPVTGPGDYAIEIIATGNCGADTCLMQIDVQADQPPALTLPPTLTFERCPGDTDPICINGVFAMDAESEVTVSKVCGIGGFAQADPGSGQLCFVPDTFGTYTFCFEADDGCNTVEDTLLVDVVLKDDCDVCLRVTIDGGECTPVGLRKTVAMNFESNEEVGGFSILMGYDASILSFQNATIDGGVIEDWEYFTWNLGGGACGTACPSGIVRFVGIADQNNGAAHPPDSAYGPSGPSVFIEYQVANDQNIGGFFIPINFVWYACADNSFSDPSGGVLFIDRRIYTYEGVILWDETDDVQFPESARPFGLGAPDDCISGGDKSEPLRCIEYVNGGVCITHPDSIDDRGDINLNGLAYEISDVVTFTNYFIKGLSAFTVNIAGQIAATDVNADGLTLTVADLSYLIRVVIGDADPIPRPVPYSEEVLVATAIGSDLVRISTEAPGDIGAMYLVYDLDPGIRVDDVRLSAAAQELDLMYGVTDGQLKLLVFDIGPGRIAPGNNSIIEIPYSGDGSLRLVYSEISDYYGRPYPTVNLKATLPESYSLGQNYPNPFNPSTTIRFTLPQPTAWGLRIYNVAGGLVREFNGSDGAGTVEVVWDGRNQDDGTVASGIYLYRLEAGGFSASRKMILLK